MYHGRITHHDGGFVFRLFEVEPDDEWGERGKCIVALTSSELRGEGDYPDLDHLPQSALAYIINFCNSHEFLRRLIQG